MVCFERGKDMRYSKKIFSLLDFEIPSNEEHILEMEFDVINNFDHHPYGDGIATEVSYEVIKGTETFFLNGNIVTEDELREKFGDDITDDLLEVLVSTSK